jgi:hypothetical protein
MQKPRAKASQFWVALPQSLKLLAIACSFSDIAMPTALAQISVLTQHNDIGRTGQNTKETVLTPANVNATNFGKLFTQVVDGSVYAQPLYMQSVTIPTKGTHNVVFVATENDSVYAFDADNNGGVNDVPLWVENMATPAHGAAPGATAAPSIDIGSDIQPIIGITGTPVIDPVAGTIYVVSFTAENSNFVLRLHALKIASGQEQRGSPVTITATVTGNGNGSSGDKLTFDPRWENQRPGLLLLNGIVYVAFAAHGDAGPWHGWLFAYNGTTLQQLSVYCASAAGVGGGFWNSGAGIAADTDDATTYPDGRLFAVTGNGDFSATATAQAGADYGDSVIQLAIPETNIGNKTYRLTLNDSFTPSDQSYLDASDGDLGSGGAIVIPDADSTTPLLFAAGKEGKLYLLDRGSLGGYNTTDKVVQEIANGSGTTSWGAGLWGLPAYWNKTIYYPGRNSTLQEFQRKDGLLTTTPVGHTTEVLSYPAPTPSVSANGTANGIVWLLESTNPSTANAVLEAYNATNLDSLLYSSQTDANRDALGTGIKFSIPTIANGKVYAASTTTDPSTGALYGQINVYGLLASVSTAAAPVFDPGAESFSGTLSVKIADSTAGSVIYYTTDGSTPTGASTRYTEAIGVSSNETITAVASAPGYLQSIPVAEVYTSNSQVPNPTVSLKTGIYTNSVSITLTDSLSKAAIYYTTDGSTPTSSSNLYKGAFSIAPTDTSTITLNVIALASGLTPSDVITRKYNITVEGTSISFPSGFSAAGSTLQLNGSTDLDDTRLQLTSGALNQAGSAFYTTQVQINYFTTDFTFQLSNPVANGFAFVLESPGTKSLGSNGAGFGYEGIEDSMALVFNFYESNSIGILVDGSVTPSKPFVNLNGTGIDLASDDTFEAALVYNYGALTLTVTLTDIVTSATWTGVFSVDLPALVAGQTAYAGFTGSTNATGSSSQKVETWTYLAGIPAPTFSPAAGTYTSTQTVSITSSISGAYLYYTLNGTTPTTASTRYTAPLTVKSTETIKAIAVVPNTVTSPMASATYTINP